MEMDEQRREHEEGIIESFILLTSRQRVLGFLGNDRHRRKVTNGLAHQRILDPSKMFQIPKDQQTMKAIVKMLKLKKAPQTCYVISENPVLDGQFLELSDALNATIGYGMGTIISCIPGKLAYYEGEEKNERYLLMCN